MLQRLLDRVRSVSHLKCMSDSAHSASRTHPPDSRTAQFFKAPYNAANPQQVSLRNVKVTAIDIDALQVRAQGLVWAPSAWRCA